MNNAPGYVGPPAPGGSRRRFFQMKRFWLGAGLGVCVLLSLCTAIFAATPAGQEASATGAASRTAGAIVVATTEAEEANAAATEAARPTDTPGPTNTPEPTSTPEPTETPEPTVAPTATPEPISFSGNGNGVTDDFIAPAEVLLVRGSHNGGSNFIVQAFDAESAELVDIVLNGLGGYNGQGVLEAEAGGEYYLEVLADGSWELVVGVPDLAAAREGMPLEISGQDSTVSEVVRLPEGRVNLTYAHDGEGNFIVQLYDAVNGNLIDFVVNELGAVTDKEGVMRVPEEGLYMFDVLADGNWTMTLSQ